MNESMRTFVAALAASLVLGYFSIGDLGGNAGGEIASNGEALAAANGVAAGGQAGEAAAASGAAPGQVVGGTQGGGASGGVPVARAGLSCKPGNNGGPTDVGVSANKIRLAATVVLDGAAASLLRESRIGMQSVVAKVNSQGGICGRGVELVLANDSFDQQRGQQYIRTWATDRKENIFALAVVPSAEGLGAAIKAGVISKAKIPVVGTDGMRNEQYNDPWVWPVATATASTMRIMAKHGYSKRGARTFAIVYDSRYKFGKEGADAFVAQVGKLGGQVVIAQDLDPSAPSYSTEVNSFNQKCGGNKCDMVAMLLLPDTAQKWLTRKPAMGAKYTAGAQTLFTNSFAQQCASAAGVTCHGLAVWTGYTPPIDRYAGFPDVAEYVNDVKRVAPTADTRNQFLEGAYLGMRFMVEALRRTGPDLTRARLAAVLDSMSLKNDITAGLQWRPGRHHANVKARSFSMVLSGSSFLGWRDEQTGWVQDPSFGG